MIPSSRDFGLTAAEMRAASPAARNQALPHISICICTYRRLDLLGRLLDELLDQHTKGLFTYSIVVADNDHLRSAEPLIRSYASSSPIPIKYCVEPKQNIALARNRAIENTDGDLLAFIDDDEFPIKNWLCVLFETHKKYGVAGVLGPVLRHFDETPPRWLERSRLYTRPIRPTGSIVRWEESRTGNVLLSKDMLIPGESPFCPEFRAGEDQDFFRRKIENGYKLIWSAEAVVYEVVPPSRWSRRYMLRKALLRGATASLQPNCGFLSIAKSILAVPIYVLILPVAFFCGHHSFMSLLIKLCDHLGKLLALIGLNPVKEEYVVG